MVQSFTDFVRARRNGLPLRPPSGSERAASDLDIEGEIDDLLSDLGSVNSNTTSTYGRMIVRRAPTVADARIQRLEIEVLRLSDEIVKLAKAVKDLLANSPLAST